MKEDLINYTLLELHQLLRLARKNEENANLADDWKKSYAIEKRIIDEINSRT